MGKSTAGRKRSHVSLRPRAMAVLPWRPCTALGPRALCGWSYMELWKVSCLMELEFRAIAWICMVPWLNLGTNRTVVYLILDSRTKSCIITLHFSTENWEFDIFLLGAESWKYTVWTRPTPPLGAATYQCTADPRDQTSAWTKRVPKKPLAFLGQSSTWIRSVEFSMTLGFWTFEPNTEESLQMQQE